MMALVAGVFVASVLGSLHCAGMCGAFLALAVAPVGDQDGAGRATRVARHARLQLAYHAGRLATYVVLGMIAGAAGSVLDMGASMVGLQRGAAALAGATVAIFGAATLLRLQGVRVPRMPVPGVMRRAATSGHRRAMDLPPFWRAGTIGLLTTLLPCGWLYAFVVSAAGTGSWSMGALVMAVFWLGTLPVMVSLGAGLRAATGALGERLPTVTAVALIALGIGALSGRVPMIGSITPERMSAWSAGGGAAAAGSLVPTSVEGMPCCHGN